MPLFGKSPTIKDQVRANEKEIRKTSRGLDREKNELERQEQKLQLEIKQAAKRGDKQVLAILAKQLLSVRKQKTKIYGANSKIQSIGTHQKLMHSNMKVAEAVGNTSKAMQSMNKIMKPEKIAMDMKKFERENAKLEMTEEMINDTMDEVFNESGDEEEQDAIVSQVLDEIGIEISGKLVNAPSASKSQLETKSINADEELEKQLAQLKGL